MFSIPYLKLVTVAGTAALTLGAGVVAASAFNVDEPFGQQVKQTVADCKASAARTGDHGIGQCVASWVRAHHPASDARDTNEVEADSAGAAPAGAEAPRSNPHAPSSVPVGRPASIPTPPAGHYSGGSHPSGSDHPGRHV